MIKIAIIGDIGSGKSHVAKLFGYPGFNADIEVAKLYKKNRRCYKNLKKSLLSVNTLTNELKTGQYDEAI